MVAIAVIAAGHDSREETDPGFTAHALHYRGQPLRRACPVRMRRPRRVRRPVVQSLISHPDHRRSQAATGQQCAVGTVELAWPPAGAGGTVHEYHRWQRFHRVRRSVDIEIVLPLHLDA
ncbi:hypothetical protein [Nocardia terpenica]|uniref:hypothetical protein n=1 Tax=Nocardia terpenica TaxID=455432 RepID=UPI0012E8362B|nr:hypothetical protein [Nocardia terpenica]NQE87484.1 hypothetical protein [Nocardia terpenica]